MGRRPKSTGNTEELRDRIIRTALELFTSKGYFNTSVHDIRRAANISIGAIYHHFESKEEIANAIYDSLVDRMTKAFLEIVGGNDTAHDRCRAVMALLFKMADGDPAEMEFMLYAKHREFMPSAKPVCSSKPLTMMREIVQLGIVNGEIRDMDVTVATTCLFGGMFRMINIYLDGVVEGPLNKYLDVIWESGWRAVAR